MQKIAVLLMLLLLLEIIRRFLPQIMTKAAGAGALNGIGQAAIHKQPDWVTLNRVSPPEWKNAAAIDELVRPLKSAGFADVGAYAVDKMPGVLIEILVKPEDCVIAHVYEHPKAETWLELVTRYEDGSSAVLSTMPRIDLNSPPFITTIRASKRPTDELYRRFMLERKRDRMQAVNSDNAPRSFEEAYAKIMAWRKNAAISAEEMKQVVEKWAAKRAAAH